MTKRAPFQTGSGARNWVLVRAYPNSRVGSISSEVRGGWAAGRIRPRKFGGLEFRGVCYPVFGR
jgi:hypothetical protein